MNRKSYAPILFGCFCLTIIFWIIYATNHENARGRIRLDDATSIEYLVPESDTLLNGKHYVQIIDVADKEVNIESYICHIIYFFAALAIFVLMLIMLDITKEDYHNANEKN